MSWTLPGILAYVGLQLVIGYVVSRRIRTEDDYLLAGRKLGYMLATFSIFATWFGAESCIGTAGAAYTSGLGGVTADPFGYALCLFLMGALLAVPLWNMKLTTVADFFRDRFSPSAERLTALIMVPTSVLWAAAQVRAFGQVLAASSDIGVTTAVTIAAAIVIVYTIMGGMLADAISDVVQGVVLVAGLIILGVIVVQDAGGIAAAAASVGEAGGLFRQEQDFDVLAVAESWAIPVCGSLIAQEVVSRVLSSRSATVAKRSSLVASGAYLLVGLIPLSLGLIGFRLLPGLEHGEQILPLLAREHLSDILYVVFAGAIVSSILSTVDSALLASAALLAHNVILPSRPQIAERHKVRMERGIVAASGILAFVLALHAEGVYDLVKDASSFGSAGIFTAFMFGMFTRFGDQRNALAALVTGVLVWVTAHYFLRLELSYLLSLGCSIAAYVVPRPKKFLFPATW